MQIHADKRAAILKFDIGKTADRKRAIFRRIPARRELLGFNIAQEKQKVVYVFLSTLQKNNGCLYTRLLSKT